MIKQGIGNIFILLFFLACPSPSESTKHYWLSPRLRGVRTYNVSCYQGKVLFPHGPECADEELSKDLTRSHAINLGFNLTFMGHRFEQVGLVK